jgi:hypothetical protein
MVYSIDWLQFSAYVDVKTFDVLKFNGVFKIERLNFATRHFKEIIEIYDTRQNKRVSTITYKPHSDTLPKNIAIIKIDNWLLYQNYLKTYLNDFIQRFNIQFKNLSRVDICADFNTIAYRNLKPQSFIKSFLSGKYIKLRKSKGQVYFNNGEILDFQYLKFGSGRSRVCSYMYNKTKELDEVLNKPHIRENWRKNNLSGEVWRCEFRLQNFDFLLTDKETGEQINFNGNIAGLNSLDIINQVQPLFDALADHYLTFKIKSKDSNKSRLKSFYLFNNNKQFLFNRIYNDNIEAGRAEKIFIKKLYELNNELRGTDHELSIYGEQVLKKVINATELYDWAKHKQII